MISEYDLQEAIAECKGARNPNASTCIKLASYLTIKKELYGSSEPEPAYSYAPGHSETVLYLDSGTEFAEKINGREQSDVLPILDELMEMLMVLHPKIYNSVMRKL